MITTSIIIATSRLMLPSAEIFTVMTKLRLIGSDGTVKTNKSLLSFFVSNLTVSTHMNIENESVSSPSRTGSKKFCHSSKAKSASACSPGDGPASLAGCPTYAFDHYFTVHHSVSIQLTRLYCSLERPVLRRLTCSDVRVAKLDQCGGIPSQFS